MRNTIAIAITIAATAAGISSPAAAQRYFARQNLAKAPSTEVAAPVALSTCDPLRALYTISQYGTLKLAGTPKLKTLALAKSACETAADAAVCYVIEDTTPSTGSVFYAYTSEKGTVGYVGSFPGQVNYATYCRPK